METNTTVYLTFLALNKCLICVTLLFKALKILQSSEKNLILSSITVREHQFFALFHFYLFSFLIVMLDDSKIVRCVFVLKYKIISFVININTIITNINYNLRIKLSGKCFREPSLMLDIKLFLSSKRFNDSASFRDKSSIFKILF